MSTASQLNLFPSSVPRVAQDIKPYLGNRKLKVRFHTSTDSHIVTGRQAQTILWLATKGKKGVSALEMSSWALRLAAYVHILKSKHDLQIVTQREKHDGGTHARYVLLTPVEIIKIEQIK